MHAGLRRQRRAINCAGKRMAVRHEDPPAASFPHFNIAGRKWPAGWDAVGSLESHIEQHESGGAAKRWLCGMCRQVSCDVS